jgi:hypothetical protein
LALPSKSAASEKPSLSVSNAIAVSWSATGTITLPTCVIRGMPSPFERSKPSTVGCVELIGASNESLWAYGVV